MWSTKDKLLAVATPAKARKSMTLEMEEKLLNYSSNDIDEFWVPEEEEGSMSVKNRATIPGNSVADDQSPHTRSKSTFHLNFVTWFLIFG